MNESTNSGCGPLIAILGAVLSGLLLAFGGALPGEPVAAAPRLSILTYNTHLEAVMLEPMVQVIRDANADVVNLQEVTRELGARLRADLADRYPYTYETQDTDVYNGQMLLSAYPILEQEAWPHPRRLLRAQIAVNGTPVTLYNIHPTSPGSVAMSIEPRGEEIVFALDLIAAETTPVLLMGDFNMEPFGRDYDQVSAVLTDAWAAVGEGPGFTYPDYRYPQAQVNARFPTRLPTPIIRIDYVFYSPGLQAVEAQVWPDSGGSDHRPLYAVFEVVAATG
jgi:endonuclease/exonuclease/phosphatase (EEP) superfamily protein YafD